MNNQLFLIWHPTKHCKKRRNYYLVNFVVAVNHKIKLTEKIIRLLDLKRNLKKRWEHEDYGDTSCIRSNCNKPKVPGRDRGGSRYQSSIKIN